MSELRTVSQVSREYGVSTRMLRYYEKPGLLASSRREDYAYRVYSLDEETSAHLIGEDPEDRAGKMMADFVRAGRLWEKFPGLRLYGFNHPNPMDESGAHGIQMGNFHEWAWLDEWVRTSDKYNYCGSGDPEDMYGLLEEHLNYHDHIQETPAGEPQTTQLDLLIPVRKRSGC